MRSGRATVRSLWQRVRRHPATGSAPPTAHHELEPADRRIVDEVRSHTMTSELRIEALLQAVRHVTARDVPGAFVECGVWRGGSVLAMIRQLQLLGRADRDIYLFDTFEGMTAPSERDTSRFDRPALEEWNEAAASESRAWAGLFGEQVFTQQDVERLLHATGYPIERLHFERGAVEDTLPAAAPAQIALLRLDTDWYESTLHELVHLYPSLAPGGVLIVDDYGHWEGCRQAVDEYFSTVAAPVLLQRVDYTGRMAVKC